MIGTEVRLVAESSSPMYAIEVESSVAVRALRPAETGSERLSFRPATSRYSASTAIPPASPSASASASRAPSAASRPSAPAGPVSGALT